MVVVAPRTDAANVEGGASNAEGEGVRPKKSTNPYIHFLPNPLSFEVLTS
jgi:hypothetical protein